MQMVLDEVSLAGLRVVVTLGYLHLGSCHQAMQGQRWVGIQQPIQEGHNLYPRHCLKARNYWGSYLMRCGRTVGREARRITYLWTIRQMTTVR